MQRIGLSSCMSQSDWRSWPAPPSKDKKKMNENINPRPAKNKKEVAPPTSNGKIKKNKPAIPVKKETIPLVNGKQEKPASQAKKKNAINTKKDAPTSKPSKRTNDLSSTVVNAGAAPVITADDIKSSMSINVSDDECSVFIIFFLIGYRGWDYNEHSIKRIGG